MSDNKLTKDDENMLKEYAKEINKQTLKQKFKYLNQNKNNQNDLLNNDNWNSCNKYQKEKIINLFFILKILI